MARGTPAPRGDRPVRPLRRLVDLLGPTDSAARQSLIALVFNSITSFGAGLMLVSFESTWRRLPPMLILVPAAIGLRGNVFSTLGNRLSTSLHTGAFRVSWRIDSVLGQNLVASFALTSFLSVVLAGIATAIGTALGVTDMVSSLQLVAIAVIGGVIGSLVVAAATVLLAIGAVRYSWDLDNLVAPTVSTLGDVVTIPALWVAAELVGSGPSTRITGLAIALAATAAIVWSWRSAHSLLSTITRESLPVLTVALALSALAGVVLQKQQHLLATLPAIWVLQPAFVSSAGALGGILSGRVSTGLHIGSVEPTFSPGPTARRDGSLVFGLAVPLLLLNALGASLVARIGSGGQPGFGWVLAAATLATIATMAVVAAVSYFATIGAWHFNVDPDTYGVPIVTAVADFVGTMALVIAVVALGIT
ncbi:MAG: magnesium transporter [Actinobacteria bacterium]|nr:magnesium transporter [Actinomycetota bacterium]